jgi:hypothetical protein
MKDRLMPPIKTSHHDQPKQETGMTWDIMLGLFGAASGAREITQAAFVAGLRCLQPTDFPLTEVRH